MARPSLFDKPMTVAERQRRSRDRQRHGEEHVAQLHRAGEAAQAFTNALDVLAKTYAHLEKEHGGDKGFATWLKKNKWDVLDDEDRHALVALGRSEGWGDMATVGDSPLSPVAIWQWVKARQSAKARAKK